MPKKVSFAPSSYGLPKNLSEAAFEAAVHRAAATWQAAAKACGDIDLEIHAIAPRRLAVEDGDSVIVMRPQRWCHNERCGGSDTFPALAMGMTSAYEKKPASLVTEGDIELNATRFAFTVSDSGPSAPQLIEVSLEAVLIHEMGHALGLEDRCSSDTSKRGRNHAPDPASCTDEAKQSVMFAPELNTSPTHGDLVALCEAFGAPPPAAPAAPSQYSAPLATLVGIALLAGLLGLWRRLAR